MNVKPYTTLQTFMHLLCKYQGRKDVWQGTYEISDMSSYSKQTIVMKSPTVTIYNRRKTPITLVSPIRL